LALDKALEVADENDAAHIKESTHLVSESSTTNAGHHCAPTMPMPRDIHVGAPEAHPQPQREAADAVDAEQQVERILGTTHSNKLRMSWNLNCERM
jgi:hypothetical protein